MSDFAFHNEWRVGASPDEVYRALADIEAYPSWWPQVRAARWLPDGRGELRCRGRLPFELTFRARWVTEDEAGHVLEAELDGDLRGTSRWTVRADGDGALAVFDQAVDVRKGLLRLAAIAGRPALRRNHEAMMAGGEKGLRALLG
jgi:uncharacterized protein YndB with AHSA1/START domain